MANERRLTLEVGPTAKKVVAVAPDWPGLERGAKTAETAIEKVQAYLPRYAGVAQLAGTADEFAAISKADVVDQYRGTRSTDFWGISFAFSGTDWQPMSTMELERQLAL
ncbi:MAG: hypothetical protein WA809_07850 [Candidatus Dormiibacterota bacterium]